MQLKEPGTKTTNCLGAINGYYITDEITRTYFLDYTSPKNCFKNVPRREVKRGGWQSAIETQKAHLRA